MVVAAVLAVVSAGTLTAACMLPHAYSREPLTPALLRGGRAGAMGEEAVVAVVRGGRWCSRHGPSSIACRTAQKVGPASAMQPLQGDRMGCMGSCRQAVRMRGRGRAPAMHRSGSLLTALNTCNTRSNNITQSGNTSSNSGGAHRSPLRWAPRRSHSRCSRRRGSRTRRCGRPHRPPRAAAAAAAAPRPPHRSPRPRHLRLTPTPGRLALTAWTLGPAGGWGLRRRLGGRAGWGAACPANRQPTAQSTGA